jgi:VanZ family protein
MLLLRPRRWPTILKRGAFVAANVILLYLCLAPVKALPAETLSDKLEHAVAWAVLTLTAALLWPSRLWAGAAYALVLGAVVEVLQAVMPLGRDGDWRDWVADACGVTAAAVIVLIARRLRARR